MNKIFHGEIVGRTMFRMLLSLLLCSSASAQCIQRNFDKACSDEFPFLSLQNTRCFDVYRRALSPIPPARTISFTPGKSGVRPFKTPATLKKTPRLSSRDNRRKLIAGEARKHTHTGIVLALESGYGLYHTFVGRLRHATQFRGAHYSLTGKWESTNGEEEKQEKILSAHMNVDVDLSKRAIIALDGSYFQSDADLPQLDGTPRHQKSSLELIADLKINPSSESFSSLSVSGEQAVFTDHGKDTYDMKRLGGKWHYRHLLDIKNTLKLSSKGFLEKQFLEQEDLDTRYYSTSSLIDSLALNNAFTVEAGVLFDSYHSSEFQKTETLLAPLASIRFRVLRKTSIYTSYHPQLVFPDFTQLYIRTLYTTVNPGLHAEKLRHDLEAGIQQAFGDSATLKLGMFYQEREDFILQIDRENDNILEYLQADSARLTGFKANLQMNFRERFVQNFSYIYTQYDELSLSGIEDVSQQTFLPYQPEHHIQASLSWIAPFNFIVDFNGIYVSEQYRNWQKQSRIGARVFLNVALTQKLTEHFQVYLSGRNLSDTDIYDMIPFLDSEEITSSRLFIGGLHLRF
ncbi:MAG: TonB-dependent receptor [bacterium]|nr:TonB-dependent receptor [bacterium]